jgi:hypothetical protein
MKVSNKKRIIELEQDNRELRNELEKYQKISLSWRDMAYQYRAISDLIFNNHNNEVVDNISAR